MRSHPPSALLAVIVLAAAASISVPVYKLRGNAEVHYRTYVLRADELTYNSDTGEATATGHFTIDGGPNDDHIKASHGTYNVTAETGRFYDVTATTDIMLGAARSSRQRQSARLRRRVPRSSPWPSTRG